MSLSESLLSRPRYVNPVQTFADDSSKRHCRDPLVCELSAYLPISRLYPMTKMMKSAPIRQGGKTSSDLKPPTVLSNRTPRARVTVTLSTLEKLLLAVSDEGDPPLFSSSPPTTAPSVTPLSARMVVEKKRWLNLLVDPNLVPLFKLYEAKVQTAPLPQAALSHDDFRS